jgi:hypothetical protein
MLKLFATIGIGPNQNLDDQSDATRLGLQLAAKDGLAMIKKMTKGRGKTVNLLVLLKILATSVEFQRDVTHRLGFSIYLSKIIA